MKNKYTKHNNRNRETAKKGNREENGLADNNLVDTSFIDNSLIEQIVASEDEFEIDIIGTENIDDDDFEVNTIDMLDDEQDEDLVNRISMYEDMDDNEDEIKEFISRDYDVVSESRRRVNQPGRRKYQDKVKPAKPAKEKKKPKEKAEGESGTNIFKALWDKWLQIYKARTSQILYGTLGVLAVILIITIIVLPKSEPIDNNDPGSTPMVSDTDTNAGPIESTAEQTTQKQITISDLKAESEDSEIYKLIAGFIDAERIKLDEAAAKAYLDNDANYNLDKHKDRKRYIEAYQNIKCYKFDYISEDMYYVYVSYDLKILNIDTPTVAGEPLVVKYDKTQKKYFIHNILEGEAGDLLIAWNAPEVKVLNEDVLKRYNEAIAKDKDLKNFLEIISNKVESTEKASGENETTTTAN